MSRISRLVLFLAFVLVPGRASASIALVAHGWATGNPTATTSALNTTGATLLVIVPANYSAALSGGPSDSLSNTWHGLTSYGTSGNAFIKFFYAYNPTVGNSQTFSLTGSYPTFCVTAWSGTDTTSAVFESGTDSGAATGATSSLQPGSITSSVNGSLIIAGYGGNSNPGSAPTVNSSFASIDYGNGAGNEYAADYYLIQTTAAAVNPTLSVSPLTKDMAVAIAAFKPCAASSGAKKVVIIGRLGHFPDDQREWSSPWEIASGWLNSSLRWVRT